MAEITPAKDTYLSSYYPTWVAGSATGIVICEYGNVYRALLAFDISGLKRASSAILSAYMDVGSVEGLQATVQRMLITDWVESEATWLIYKTGNSWNADGCNGTGTDFTTLNAASSLAPASSNWQNWDITGIFNDAIKGGLNVLSVRVIGDGFVSGGAQYASKNYPLPSYRPKITYTEAPAGGGGGMLF